MSLRILRLNSQLRTGSLIPLLLLGTARIVCGVEPCPVPPAAQEVHQSALLFDGHNDLPWQVQKQFSSDWNRLDLTRVQPSLHTDLPRLRQGGVKAQFWSVYVNANTIDSGDAAQRTFEQIELVRRMVELYPQDFELAFSTADIHRIVAAGKIASLMGMEGGHSIEDSLQLLHEFYRRGVRYMTLTHTRSLRWATSSTADDSGKGLTEFGEEIVREMNRLGMLVDLSHVSVQTMRDAIRASRAPIIFSHSSVRAICDHPRNVPDEILQLLPANGGVIMINFMPGFVVPTAELKQNPKALGTVHTVVDHIEHVIRVAGVEHVGIGSDFDGVETLPVGLEDVSTYPRITSELLRRGYTPEQVRLILGGNILRVLERAEAVARELN